MRLSILTVAITFLLITGKSNAQKPEMLKIGDLKQLLAPDNDTTYVLNFWATWCRPCIQELPYFDKLNTNYHGQKLKVILVSLDFKRHIETQLIPFLKKNNIASKVFLLDEPDANLWIDIVDPSWGGAIPSTLIINSASKIRKFYENEFTYTELENIVKPLIVK